MKNRRKGREFALQALYAQAVGDTPLHRVEEKIIQGLQAGPEAAEYGKLLMTQVMEHKKEIDGIIAKHTRDWKPDRLAVIDNILIRCGIVEMKYMTKIPAPVVITEAVQIARKYSSPKSPSFINGILDSIAAESSNPNRKE
jgi:N utilization substance protein B